MAGFFLSLKEDIHIDTNKVLNEFKSCGMSSYSQYNLGAYDLFLFHKMTASTPSIFESEKGICAAVGAYVYKGLNYKESLKQTLYDCFYDKLKLSEMYGQYTLILYVNEQIIIISDALSAKHFFSDQKFSFFSSSFFAAVAAVGATTINEKAVFEKLLTGIIVSPDTLVNEVIQINKNEQTKANNSGCKIRFIVHPEITIPPVHNSGMNDSVTYQAENISHYFEILKPALSEGRVDLGLSAGHDSSLLFAAIANEYNNIHIHTHSTGHVHDKEKNAAIAMARIKGIDTTIIPTPRLDESDIDLDKLLHENLCFFDGRTSHDIGGFSATYRAEYRLKATDECMTTLTGVGGECLRNHYSVRGSTIRAEKFFKDKIFNRSFIESAPVELIDTVSEFHISKAESILKTQLRGNVNRINLRRYYSEILMADGQGNVVDAYNIVSKCIAPFLDPFVLIEAYRGINYLGNCGEYESAIICALDTEIGSCINANNGYPFDDIPLKLRMKEEIRSFVSSQTWEKLNHLKNSGLKHRNNDYFFSVIKKSQGMKDAFENLKSRYPNIDFYKAIDGYAMDALIEYLALTVGKLTND